MGLLGELGYHDVRHYVGGLEDWTKSNLPLEGSHTVGARAAGAGATRRAAPGVPMAKLRRGLRGGRFLAVLTESSFGGLFGLWILVVAAFGLLYWLLGLWGAPAMAQAGAPVRSDLRGLGTAIYFSFVTATSVGFGDVVPLGLGRLVAVVEAGLELLVFGCVVSKLVSSRQELLTEEIHRISFEDRLGRVRTNLHLVLSELQAIALARAAAANAPATTGVARAVTAAATSTAPSDRLLPRVESLAMVFLGELRTVHDLLYRPQQRPDDQVLEGLLASVAANLRELRDLSAWLRESTQATATLNGTAASIARLAAEICGECTPRQHVPEVKLWMDRIQEIAQRIS